MFCKWCGADLPNTANKCTRCGKDIPAMSDCGGFFDLVPNAKRHSTEVPVSQLTPKAYPVSVEPSENNPPKRDIPTKGKESRQKSNSFQLLTTCVGFIVVIALLLGINSKVGKILGSAEESGEKILSSVSENDRKIDTIYEEILQIKESIQGEEAEETTPPTDGETIPNNILLEEQDARIEISVNHAEDGFSVKTASDFGDFKDTVIDQVMFDRATQSLSGVRIDLSEAENCIVIRIENKLAASDVDEGSISVVLEVDEIVFAESQNDAEYEWAYRINGSTEWTSPDENVFTISMDGATVTYAAEELTNLLADAEMAEFKLTYTRDNVKGGSLTIVLSGITITNQSIDTNQPIDTNHSLEIDTNTNN